MKTFAHYIIESPEETLMKVLALADRPGTPEEGEAAMEMAKRYAAKHNLKISDFRGKTPASPSVTTSGHGGHGDSDEWNAFWQQIKRYEIEKMAAEVGFKPLESHEYGFFHILKNEDFYIKINVEHETWSLTFQQNYPHGENFVIANGRLGDTRKLKTALKGSAYKNLVENPKIQAAIDLAKKFGFVLDTAATTARFAVLHKQDTTLVILKENGNWGHLPGHHVTFEQIQGAFSTRMGGSKKLSELRAYLKGLS